MNQLLKYAEQSGTYAGTLNSIKWQIESIRRQLDMMEKWITDVLPKEEEETK